MCCNRRALYETVILKLILVSENYFRNIQGRISSSYRVQYEKYFTSFSCFVFFVSPPMPPENIRKLEFFCFQGIKRGEKLKKIPEMSKIFTNIARN